MYILAGYRDGEPTAVKRISLDEGGAQHFLALMLEKGWYMHPFNRTDHGGFYEWIFTEQPGLADRGPACKLLYLDHDVEAYGSTIDIHLVFHLSRTV